MFRHLLLSACFLLLSWPAFPQNTLALAVQRIQASDAVGAARLLQEHLRQTPADAAAWNLLGIAQAEVGEFREAERAFQQALALTPNALPAHENYGAFLVRRGEWPRAKTELQKAVELGSANPDVSFQLALCRLHTGEPARAQEDLLSLEAALGNRASYWEERGIAESRTDLVAAAASLDRALALDRSRVRTLLAAAYVAEQRKNTEQALSLLLEARAKAPHEPGLLVQFGRVCLERDLGQDALEALEEAYRLQPANEEALYLLAAAHVTVERYERAQELLSTYVKRVPRHPTAYYSLGWLQRKLNHPDDARQSLERAVALAPEFAAPLLELAELDLEAGEVVRSEQRAKAVLQRQPQSARAHLLLGDVARQQERWDEAQTFYEAAIRDDAKLAAAHSRLARLLLRRKDQEGAAREQKLAAALNEQAKKESRRALRLAVMEPER